MSILITNDADNLLTLLISKYTGITMAAETSNETLPLWLQELIQTNRSGLVSIVTKNISIENVDEEKGNVADGVWNMDSGNIIKVVVG